MGQCRSHHRQICRRRRCRYLYPARYHAWRPRVRPPVHHLLLRTRPQPRPQQGRDEEILSTLGAATDACCVPSHRRGRGWAPTIGGEWAVLPVVDAAVPRVSTLNCARGTVLLLCRRTFKVAGLRRRLQVYGYARGAVSASHRGALQPQRPALSAQ